LPAEDHQRADLDLAFAHRLPDGLHLVGGTPDVVYGRHAHAVDRRVKIVARRAYIEVQRPDGTVPRSGGGRVQVVGPKNDEIPLLTEVQGERLCFLGSHRGVAQKPLIAEQLKGARI
jgi:hypothetical protein